MDDDVKVVDQLGKEVRHDQSSLVLQSQYSQILLRQVPQSWIYYSFYFFKQSDSCGMTNILFLDSVLDVGQITSSVLQVGQISFLSPK